MYHLTVRVVGPYLLMVTLICFGYIAQHVLTSGRDFENFDFSHSFAWYFCWLLLGLMGAWLVAAGLQLTRSKHVLLCLAAGLLLATVVAWLGSACDLWYLPLYPIIVAGLFCIPQ